MGSKSGCFLVNCKSLNPAIGHQSDSILLPTTTRKLAVIMFTDIVGYIALMGSDENRALKVLAHNPLKR